MITDMKHIKRITSLYLIMLLLFSAIFEFKPVRAASDSDNQTNNTIKTTTLYIPSETENDTDADSKNYPSKGTIISEDGTVIHSTYKSSVSYAKLIGISRKEAKSLKVTAVSSTDGIVKLYPKKRKLEAAGIGETTITLSDKKGNEYEAVIKVKKSADKVVFGGYFVENNKKYELKTYQSYEISLPRIIEGIKTDTDQRRLTVINSKGKDVTSKVVTEAGARVWKLEFTTAGDYTVTGEAFQSKFYPEATAKTSVKIKVTESDITGLQTAYNAFTLSFAAGKLAENSAKTTSAFIADHSKADAAELIKITQVLDNGIELPVSLRKATAVGNDVIVESFTPFEEGLKYKAECNGQNVSFTACEWIPTHIGNRYIYTPDAESDGGTAVLYTDIYTKGSNGQDIDITGMLSGSSYVSYEDMSSDYDPKYYVIDNTVVFQKNDKAAHIKSVIVIYDAEKEFRFENTFTVQASDTRRYAVVAYDLSSDSNVGDPGSKRTAALSIADNAKYIRVKIGVDIDGDGVYGDDNNHDNDEFATELDYIYSDNDNVTFMSANSNKLLVNETSGMCFSVTDSESTVGVFVYYKGKLIDGDASTTDIIDPIYIDLYHTRKMAELSVDIQTDGKYTYSTITDDGCVYPVDSDFERVSIKVTDQLGSSYNDATVTVEKITNVLDHSLNPSDYVWMGESASKSAGKDYSVISSDENSLYTTIMDKSSGNIATLKTSNVYLYFVARSSDTGTRNLMFRVSAIDNVTGQRLEKIFSFTVNNVTASKVTSMKIEKEDTYEFRVVGVDSTGNTICGYYLDSPDKVKSGDSNITKASVSLGFYDSASGELMEEKNDYIYAKTATLKTVISVTGGALTKISGTPHAITRVVSGGSITVSNNSTVLKTAKYTRVAKAYIDKGTYLVRAFKRSSNGTMVPFAITTLDYSPSKAYKLSFIQNKTVTEYTDIVQILDDCFRFTTYRWEKDDIKASNAWVAYDTDTRFSAIGNKIHTSRAKDRFDADITISYQVYDKSVYFMYAYIIDKNKVYTEIPILKIIHIK